MLNWLSGKNNKKKKQLSKPTKTKDRQGLPAKTPGHQSSPTATRNKAQEGSNVPMPKRENPQDVMNKMGGAEELAKAIRTLLAEDKDKRR